MPKETLQQKRTRTQAIIELLRKRYPDARTALTFSNPLELLVATILSAQCTDVRVNLITPDLFARYKTVRDYAAAPQEVLEREIHSAGFFRNKAKAIRGAAKAIVENFGGRVPDAMEGLLTLPGVARKTANVVLGSAFGKNEGIVVDTHVTRVSNRLKLTRHPTNAGDKIEADLVKLVPRRGWDLFGHLLVWHGRAICTARKPDCAGCPVNKLCPSASAFA